ncbi:unnamed protein product [Strongylus vulgaris]|uniref:Uncharacterized protein n=1 Tax=Strongylus vulgaris TaxID=40348 RepID=A0A3P7LGD1_STRVU|nr:unnamed protein product [Strongylus vulgaris]
MDLTIRNKIFLMMNLFHTFLRAVSILDRCLDMNRTVVAAFLLTFAVAYAFQPDDQFSGMEKRKSAYMRFGRSDPELTDQLLLEKRKSAYMRFGKRSEVPDEDSLDMEKRKSAYMRFGKRKSAYMRSNSLKSKNERLATY